MNDKITNVFLYPSDFCIKSLPTAKAFMDMLPVGCVYDIQDANDDRYYYRILKNKEGRVEIGHALYGPDPFLADPVFMSCDPHDVVHKVYAARKSINSRFFKKQE